jgi:hypothetical protein
MSRRAKAVLVALAGLLVLPAAAAADTVKIGSALAKPAFAELGATVGVQQAQSGGPGALSLTSPTDGTIVAWAVRSVEPGAVYKLRVLRPAGALGYLGAGTNTAPTPIPNNTDTIYNYPASLPIKAGDAIGVSSGSELPSSSDNVPADVIGYSNTLFADGATSGPVNTTPGHELLLQATVKFCKVPDLSGQKAAAAQQLLAAGDCAAGPIAKKKLKRTKKNKKRKKGKILSQTLTAGTTTAPGTAVGLTVGKLKKK